MKKLPFGVSNYEELIRYNCYYIDKTKYIEMLENLNSRRLMFLRPRRFGKTLFTSVLENYYDIDKKDKFDELFGETYIGKNPTALRNSYYILYFNFSGVNTDTVETTVKSFYGEILSRLEEFILKYNFDFKIKKNEGIEVIQKKFFS